eukprot:5589947-Amphidinium_carterae.1
MRKQRKLVFLVAEAIANRGLKKAKAENREDNFNTNLKKISETKECCFHEQHASLSLRRLLLARNHAFSDIAVDMVWHYVLHVWFACNKEPLWSVGRGSRET